MDGGVSFAAGDFLPLKYIRIILLNSSSTQTKIYRDLHDNL